MFTPTAFELQLGKTLRAAFGAQTRVVRFGDDERKNDVLVVSGVNHPVDGTTSYGSIGLSRHPQQVGKASVKVEIVAACASVTPHIDNLVASCVLDSMKNGSRITYGSHIDEILVQYGISKTLRHVTFVAPFLWSGLDRIVAEGETVHCLMLLPISDAERTYLATRGIDALEKLFEERQIDIYDINRASALR